MPHDNSTSGPKTYAQVVKETPTRAPPTTVFSGPILDLGSLPATVKREEETDDWSDISSLTSCTWPESTVAVTESISSGCSSHQDPSDEYSQQLHDEENIYDNAPLDYTYGDHRAEWRLAGRVKHTNHARWLHYITRGNCKPWLPITKYKASDNNRVRAKQHVMAVRQAKQEACDGMKGDNDWG